MSTPFPCKAPQGFSGFVYILFWVASFFSLVVVFCFAAQFSSPPADLDASFAEGFDDATRFLEEEAH
jgi:hypothetical protein